MDYVIKLEHTLNSLENAINALLCVDGMEEYANRLKALAASIELELIELRSVEGV